MNTYRKIVSILLLALLLTACGGADISGTYRANDSALRIKFDENKAYVTGLISMETIECTYKMAGDKITVDGPDGHPHLKLTRNHDGTLHLETGGGDTLTKTDSNS